jgi:hypothetical protein
MPKRMLKVFGGLLAVAALIVAPSAASGDSAPTAKISGNGNSDQYPPSSQWGNGWWGPDGNGGRNWQGWGDGNGYFDGSSSDRGGNGGQHGNAARPAGKVDRVMVAVKRLRGGGRCQHLYRSGLSSTGSCTGTHWMRAKGTTSWRYDIPTGLPSGRYRLQRRAVDAAGNRERTHLLHVRIR